MTISDIITLDYWMILPLFFIGSALHFVYNWVKHNKKVAIFAAVNESYWEHIKIAFWPIFILYLIEFILGGYSNSAFIPAKTIALYSIPLFMIGSVFGYKHFTKKNILFIDISAFFVTIALSQVIGSLLLDQIEANIWTILISAVFLIFIFLAFIMFTKFPPKEPDLFRDPITSKYGLRGHK